VPHPHVLIVAAAGLALGCTRAPETPAAATVTGAEDPREARCRAGSFLPHDCFDAGNAYDRGADGHVASQDRAIELYAIGCKARPDDPSCGALKNEIVSLQLTVSRRGEALRLLGTACREGNLDLCNDLASAYRDGIGVSPQPLKAAELFERTCLGPDSGAGAVALDAMSAACRGLVLLLDKDDVRAVRAAARGKELAPRR